MTYFDMVSMINARMKELKWSKSRLAIRVSVDRGTLSEWLNFHTTMRGDDMFAILHALGLDAQVIYKQEEE